MTPIEVYESAKNSRLAYGTAFSCLLLGMECVQNKTTRSPIRAPEVVRRDGKHVWIFV